MSQTTPATLPTFEVRSHSVNINPYAYTSIGRGMAVDKEEAFFHFHTTWRGNPATVTVSADRYLHSSGMSEWRLYVSDAREGDDVYGGHPLTQTARARLRETLIPIAREWLESSEYTASRQIAFADALRDMARELSPRHNSTANLRRAISMFADELSDQTTTRLLAAADAYDEFTSILNGEDA